MKQTKGQKITMSQVYPYLLGHGIPRQMIDSIRVSLIYDAMTEAHNIAYDRIYTGIALMLNDVFNLSAEQILDGLTYFDKVCAEVIMDPDHKAPKDWMDHMDRLREETGIVVYTGDDKRLIVESLKKGELKDE